MESSEFGSSFTVDSNFIFLDFLFQFSNFKLALRVIANDGFPLYCVIFLSFTIIAFSLPLPRFRNKPHAYDPRNGVWCLLANSVRLCSVWSEPSINAPLFTVLIILMIHLGWKYFFLRAGKNLEKMANSVKRNNFWPRIKLQLLNV